MPIDVINGVRMHYEVYGEGTPIIFIHPPVTPGACFSNQTAYLQQQFQVITFDLRGHGDSEASSEPFSYFQAASDIEGLLNHLHIDKAVICGYSTGNQIALEFALNYSERVIGGVLIGGMPAVRPGTLAKLVRLGIFTTKRWMPLVSLGLSITNAKDLDQFKTIYRRAKKSEAAYSEAYFRCSLTYDCTSQLEQLHLPMLLVYGERDRWVLPYGNMLQRLLPNNEFVLIAKAGHRLPSRAPDALNQLIANFVLRHNEYLPLNQLTMLAET